MQMTEILDRYMTEVAGDARRIGKARVLKQHLGEVALADLGAGHVVSMIEDRLAAGISPQTVRHDYNGLKAILKHARVRWRLPVPACADWTDDVDLPELDNERDRRLESDEEAALIFAAINFTRSDRMEHAMILALETAMRRGELVALTWSMVDLDKRVIRLPAKITKTKTGRTIPLSRRAVEVLSARRGASGDSVLGLSADALNLSWKRLRERAAERCPSVATFHWHDFRHEALSRLAEKGWSLPQLQVVSGHRSYRMLQRYVRIRAEDLVAKMDD